MAGIRVRAPEHHVRRARLGVGSKLFPIGSHRLENRLYRIGAARSYRQSRRVLTVAGYRMRVNNYRKEITMSHWCPTPKKKSFDSKTAANKALIRFAHRQREQGDKVPVQRSYRCACGKYHHSSQDLNNQYSKFTGPAAYARRMALIQATREHYSTG